VPHCEPDVEQINRYLERPDLAVSSLDQLDDIKCWVQGLTSATYVRDLLRSRHDIRRDSGLQPRSDSIARLVDIACKYMEQADKGPQEVSFLPLYYVCLNLLKAYVVAGPYEAALSTNRHHGAGYDANRDPQSLDDDIITLYGKGAIPLFYQTMVGQSIGSGLELRMRDVYPYIRDVAAEYSRVTKGRPRLIPFVITVEEDALKGSKRLKANYIDRYNVKFSQVATQSLQAFAGLRREKEDSRQLVSRWHSSNDDAAIRAHIRPAMLYNEIIKDQSGPPVTYNLVPLSAGKLLLPEELPLVLAFYHMSNVVRYSPDGVRKLMNSKYWPVLLVLRRHGLYRFLVLFWSFMNQRCTHIVGR